MRYHRTLMVANWETLDVEKIQHRWSVVIALTPYSSNADHLVSRCCGEYPYLFRGTTANALLPIAAADLPAPQNAGRRSSPIGAMSTSTNLTPRVCPSFTTRSSTTRCTSALSHAVRDSTLETHSVSLQPHVHRENLRQGEHQQARFDRQSRLRERCHADLATEAARAVPPGQAAL